MTRHLSNNKARDDMKFKKSNLGMLNLKQYFNFSRPQKRKHEILGVNEMYN